MVDDDTKLCSLVADYLEPMGYQVDAAHDGVAGLEQLDKDEYQAVILDVMMPRMDGFETLKKIRESSDIPVLMLTARGEETDRIVGLEMGADDYLPKTFSSRELLARLRAVTRRFGKTVSRREQEMEKRRLVIDDLTVNLDSRTVYLGEEVMTLTPIEYDLLVRLAQSPGQVLSRDQLLDAVAGRSYDVFDRSIDVHISSLRRKLGENPKQPRFIKTVRSVGYMFIEPQD